MLGLQSTRHDWKKPITIDFADAAHPIVKGMESWTTIDEELYNNVSVLGAHTLAKGRQVQKNKETGAEAEVEAIVAWTNEFGPDKTRIFSTTIGHQTETVADARYLDLVARGVLWAAGKLGDDGKPVAGYGPVKK
jgi:type 1 glutamine amidotransferase